MGNRRLKAFISSSMAELAVERRVVKKSLDAIEIDAWIFEDDAGARSKTIQDTYLEEVAASNIYIGIFWKGYGAYTIDEFEHARVLDKPCLIYEKRIDLDERDEKLQNFLDRISQVESGFTIRWFHSPEEIGNYVQKDVREEIYKIYKEQQEQVITNGIKYLPYASKGKIRNFYDEYLGTNRRKVPFGGRREELAALDKWLNDQNAPSYGLIAANAGRGKSALLARWAQSVNNRNLAEVIFIPISIRFGTAKANVCFTTLAALLGEVYDESNAYTNLTTEQWRDVCLRYLKNDPPKGKQVLIIIDGLDEAVDWTPDASLFPMDPPNGLRVIVSARYQVGDIDESGWIRRLNWEIPSMAISFPLPELTREGVQDVLVAMGNPLDCLATKIDVISELHRLSEGEPLLVRLYVEALLKEGNRAAFIQPDDLAKIPTGLDGYFLRWWEDQHKMWGEKSPTNERNMQVVLNLLACAFGPLSKNDLIELSPDDADINTYSLENYLTPLRRFIIGDGVVQDFVFSHSQLAIYFYEKLSFSERKTWQSRFLEFGERTLSSLNSGDLKSDHASAYILQYYRLHLDKSKPLAKTVYALVSNGWMKAWYDYEKSYNGFLDDVSYAWQTAEEEISENVKNEQLNTTNYTNAFVEQIICALCHSSVSSLSANHPPQLLAQAIDAGLISPIQALVIAQKIIVEREQERAFSALLPKLATEQILTIYEIISKFEGKYARLDALMHIIPFLDNEVLDDALEQIWGFDNYYRNEFLVGISPHLTEDSWRWVLGTIRKLDEHYKKSCLIDLASHIPDEFISDALEIAMETRSDEVLISLIHRIPPELHHGLLINLMESSWSTSKRTNIIFKLEPNLEGGLLPFALSVILAKEGKPVSVDQVNYVEPRTPVDTLKNIYLWAYKHAKAIKWESDRVKLLVQLYPYLDKDLLDEIRGIIFSLEDERDSTELLANLLPILSEDEKGAVAFDIMNGWLKSGRRSFIPNYIFDFLIPHLPESLIGDFIWFAFILTGSDRYEVKKAIITLAPYLPDYWIKPILVTLLRYDKSKRGSHALVSIIPYLYFIDQENARNYLNKLYLEETTSSRFSFNTGDKEAFCELVPFLSENIKKQNIPIVLNTIARDRYNPKNVKYLVSLAPYIQGELLDQVIQTALSLIPESDRLKAVTALIPYLQRNQVRNILEHIILAERLSFIENALSKIGQYLSEDLIEIALNLADTLENKLTKIVVKLCLLPFLSDHSKGLTTDLILEESLSISKDVDKARILSQLVSFLSKAQKTKIISTLLDIVPYDQKIPRRIENLSRLLPHLSRQKKEETILIAVDAVEEIEDPFDRIRSISLIIPYLSGNLKEERISSALETSFDISEFSKLLKALSLLTPYLPQNLKEKAIRRVFELSFEKDYDLSEINNVPTWLWVPVIWIIFKNSRYSYDIHETLNTLVPEIPDHLIKPVFDATIEYLEKNDRHFALFSLLPSIPDEIRAKTVTLLHNMILQDDNLESQLSKILKIFPFLSNEIRKDIIPINLNYMEMINNNNLQNRLFLSFIDHLEEDERSLHEKEIEKKIASIGHELTKRIQKESDCVDMLIDLLPHSFDKTREDILLSTMKSILVMTNTKTQVMPMVKLAPYLLNNNLEETIHKTLKFISEMDRDRERKKALLFIAPFVPLEHIGNYLWMAIKLEFEWERREALKSIAPYLPDSLLRPVLRATCRIFDKSEYPSALAILAPWINETNPEVVIQYALELALSGKSAYSRMIALEHLIPHLPEEMLQETAIYATEAMLDHKDGYFSPDKLSKFVIYLPEEYLELVLKAIVSNKYDNVRQDGLRCVAPYLGEDLLTRTWKTIITKKGKYGVGQEIEIIAPYLTQRQSKNILNAAKNQNERIKVDIISAVFQHLKIDLEKIAVDEIIRIQNEFLLARCVSETTPHMSQELLPQVFERGNEVKSGPSKALILSSIAPYFPQDQQKEILDRSLVAAQLVQDDRSQLETIISLLPWLPEYITGTVINQASNIKNDADSTELLIDIAEQAQTENKDNIIQKAITKLFSIQNEYSRAKCFVNIAQLLPTDIIYNKVPQILDPLLSNPPISRFYEVFGCVVQFIDQDQKNQYLEIAFSDAIHELEENELSKFFIGVTPFLDEKHTRLVFQISMNFEEKHWKSKTLLALYPYLTLQQIKDVFLFIIEDITNRTEILCDLIPYLSEDLIETTLMITLTLKHDSYHTPSKQVQVLTALAPYLPGYLLPFVVETIYHAKNETQRKEIQYKLLSQLYKDDPKEVIENIFKIILKLSYGYEEILINFVLSRPSDPIKYSIENIIPRISYGAGQADALKSLTNLMSNENLESAFELATKIDGEKERAQALEELAIQNNFYLLKAAISELIEFKEESIRSAALEGLLPHSSEEIKELILDALVKEIQTIENPSWRIKRIVRLAPHLPEQLIVSSFYDLREMDEKDQPKEILSDLVTYLPQILYPDALDLILTHSYFYYERSLGNLAPLLPNELMISTIDEILSIDWEYKKKNLLIHLLPYIPQERIQIVLEAVMTFEDDYINKGEALSKLIPKLPNIIQSDVAFTAWGASLRSKYAWSRNNTIVKVEPFLPIPDFELALSNTRLYVDKNEYKTILISLFPNLGSEKKRVVIDDVFLIDDDQILANAFTSLLPYIPEELLPTVIQRINEFDDPSFCATTLINLAPHLPAYLMKTIMDIFVGKDYKNSNFIGLGYELTHRIIYWGQIPDDFEYPDVDSDHISDIQLGVFLVLLAPYLSEELLNMAYNSIKNIGEKLSQVSILCLLAPYLAEGSIRSIVDFIHDISHEDKISSVGYEYLRNIQEGIGITDGDDPELFVESTWISLVTPLLAHLPEDLILHYYGKAKEIINDELRLAFICALIPYLPEKLVDSAFNIVLSMSNLSLRKQVIIEMLSYLPANRQRIAVTILLAYESGEKCGQILASLGEHIPQELHQATLDLSLSNISSDTHINSLIDLIPVLSPALRGRLIEALLNEAIDSYHGERILDKLKPHLLNWVEDDKAKAVGCWCKALHKMGTTSRKNFLGTVKNLAEFTMALVPIENRNNVAMGVRQAITDVGCWWP